jgi:hypothetical protein
MSIQYQIDEHIFREITPNWLCASVREFLIKARKFETDQAGNIIEYVQISDGRVFTRLISNSHVANVAQTPDARTWNALPAYEQS